MNLITYKGKKPKFNIILEFILYSVLYTVTFLIVDKLFASFQIAEDNKILWAFISISLIYILNKLVRPVLIIVTIPITAITFGLFYFFINVIILKLADWFLQSKLDFTNFWALIVISLLLSFLNTAIEKTIIEPTLRKAKKNE